MPLFKGWMKLTRKIYNKSLVVLKQQTEILSKFDIRNKVLPLFKDDINKYRLPNASAEYACFEARTNYKNAFKTHGTCKDKTSRSLTCTMTIDGRNIRNGVIYPSLIESYLKERIPYQLITPTYPEEPIAPIFDTQKLSKEQKIQRNLYKVSMKEYKANCKAIDRKVKLDNNTIIENNKIQIAQIIDQIKLKSSPKTTKYLQIWFNRQNGEWKLLVPYNKEKEKCNHITDVVSIDPGVTPFMTFYSDKVYGNIGGSIINDTISPLLYKSDKLLEKAKAKKRWYSRMKLRKRAALLREHARNKVKDMREHATKFFAKNFKYILLPKMNIKRMVSSDKLPPVAARALLTSNQCAFRERLKQKCHEYGSTVIMCTEEYTSVTCTVCGNIHDNLGKNKTYNCVKCKSIIDRDYNGARNIMLKHVNR